MAKDQKENMIQEQEMEDKTLDVKAFKEDELLELLDDIGIAYMTCTHHPLTHIEYGTPVEINNIIVC